MRTIMNKNERYKLIKDIVARKQQKTLREKQLNNDFAMSHSRYTTVSTYVRRTNYLRFRSRDDY
jgi:uncharacterized protein YktA (UPF0223 family)